jgi:hypothetical protein
MWTNSNELCDFGHLVEARNRTLNLVETRNRTLNLVEARNGTLNPSWKNPRSWRLKKA